MTSWPPTAVATAFNLFTLIKGNESIQRDIESQSLKYHCILSAVIHALRARGVEAITVDVMLSNYPFQNGKPQRDKVGMEYQSEPLVQVDDALFRLYNFNFSSSPIEVFCDLQQFEKKNSSIFGDSVYSLIAPNGAMERARWPLADEMVERWIAEHQADLLENKTQVATGDFICTRL